MRISDPYRLGPNSAQGTPRAASNQPQGASANESAAPSGESVQVRVSARSRELSLQANGEIDVAKVARLKSAIESGTFKIDAREIAERIVRGG